MLRCVPLCTCADSQLVGVAWVVCICGGYGGGTRYYHTRDSQEASLVVAWGGNSGWMKTQRQSVR